MQPRDELLKLRHGAGATQRHGAHMIVEIDVVVLDPDRLCQFERHRRQLARQHRRQMKPLAEHRLDVFVVVAVIPLGQFEQHQAADVHRRFRRFEMQE